MKKYFSIIALVIISSMLIFNSCSKEETTDDTIATATVDRSANINNDALLLECLNNPDLDSYDKGKLFLDQESLSEIIIESLLNHSSNLNPFVIELILTSQESFTSESLKSIIDCENIDNPTLENILLSKTPLNNDINNYVYEKRDMTIANSYDNYQKLISTCDGGVIFAEKIIEIYDCNTTSFIIVNPTTKSFINLCNCEEDNTDRMLNSTGGSKWIKGKRTTTTSDGITKVVCKRPSTAKCVKVMPQPDSELSYFMTAADRGFINTINSNASDFVIGKKLINEDELSDVVLLELFKKVCDFDQFVFETIFLNQDKLSEKILVNLITNENIPDEMLTNILIVNAPMEDRMTGYIEKFRSNISIDYINQFSDKGILLSMCDQSLIIGDSITVEEKNKHNVFTVYNNSPISLYSSISESDKAMFLVGGSSGSWIKGDLILHQGGNSTDTYYCETPPNNKCLKVKKLNAALSLY